MAARRKLLFISPCTPDPQGTGWEQRAFAFLSAYSKFIDVELWFVPTADNPELARIEKSTRLCSSITPFYREWLDDTSSQCRTKLIHSLSNADVLHVFRFPGMVASIGHNNIVWDIDELPRLAPGRTSPDQQQQLVDFYSNCFRKCRKVFASSHYEKRQARFDTIDVIPNIANDPQLGEFESAEKAPVLLFVGNLNYRPNLQALAFFDASILPPLLGTISDVTVNVVGRSPVTDGARATVEHLRNSGRFRFDFDVPSCTPYYLQAVASIVPLLAGGGTRIKILESFAHRCPVITTQKGCEGLDVAHRKHLLIEDDPNNFARACVELIRDPALRKEMTGTAYAFFARNHSQHVVDRLLYSAFDNAALLH
jgi:glycosyltransferase involved in cell wall biosynthesis